jgi:hypothetical protein
VSGFGLCWGMRRWRVSVGWSFRGGSGFNIMQLTLIGLKLGGVISWPWSMVLLPLWFTIGVLFIIGLGIATAVVGGKGVPVRAGPKKRGTRGPARAGTERTTPAEVPFRFPAVTG